MPGGDRTGPEGRGPMTGRGAGYCAGYNVPGYMNQAARGGFGMGRGGWGRGRGRGWRNMYYATGLPGWMRYGRAPAWGVAPPMYGPQPPEMTGEQEAEYLKSQAEYLGEELEAIKKRISELEAK